MYHEAVTHTPGPWYCAQEQLHDNEIVIDSVAKSVAAIITEDTSDASAEEQANLRLVCAAPAMKEAYIALWTAVENGMDSYSYYYLREQFWALMAQVNGTVEAPAAVAGVEGVY